MAARRRFRVRPFAGLNRRGIRGGLSLTWAGSLIAHNLLGFSVGGSVITDLTAALNTRLGRTVDNARLKTIRGSLAINCVPVAADTQTRFVVGMGIGWFEEDRMLSAGAANLPNPLDESEQWLWRDPRAFDFNADAIGRAYDLGDNPMAKVEIHTKSVRVQPSLDHRVYFVAQLDNIANNIQDSTGAVSVFGFVNSLYGTP